MAEWKKVIVSGSSPDFAAVAVDGTVTANAFSGDGSALTGVAAGSINIDGFTTGTVLEQTDVFLYSDGGTEKKITFDLVENEIFGNVSGDATIAAGGALSIAADAITATEIADNAVTTAAIADGDVTNAKLADDAVGADELAANAVVNASVASNAAIALSKINTVSSGLISGSTQISEAGALMVVDVDNDIKTFALPANTTISSFGKTLVDDTDASAARTTLGVDAAGTDNSTDVTLANTNYLSISGQEITGDTVPVGSGGTGATTAAGARTNLGVDAAGTDNSTDVTLAGTRNYITISGQTITRNEIDISDDTNLAAGTGVTLTGDTLSIGQSVGTGDNVTFADITVTGDLTVQGTTTTIDTTNLNVTDQFINLNDGGSAADGGIVVEGQGTAFGWDNTEDRWAFDFEGATEGQTAITSDAFAVAVVTTDNINYRKNGNIRIESGEAYIYVE